MTTNAREIVHANKHYKLVKVGNEIDVYRKVRGHWRIELDEPDAVSAACAEFMRSSRTQPAPETNAEARQLDAELAETEQYNYDARAAGSYKDERWTVTVIERTADTVTFKNSCNKDTVHSLPTSEFNHSIARVVALSQPAPILVDTPAGAQYALPGLTPPAAQLRFC
jgi:hypothetical protein